MSKRKPNPSARAKRLVTQFANRADDYAFVGSMHPDDEDAVEAGYERARNNLLAYIEELEKRKPTVKSFTENKNAD